MLLPGYEPRIGTILAKVDYELSLEYQLEKVIWCAEQFRGKLKTDTHVNDLEHDTYFLLDTLVTATATLVEFYYSNVIYSLISTILDEPKKVEFRGLDESNLEQRKKEIFRNFRVGELTQGDEIFKEAHRKKCSEHFDKYLAFIISGRYDVLFEINNHIKHNGRLRGFFLKARSTREEFIKSHFLLFTNESGYLFKNKIIKKLLAADYNSASENISELVIGDMTCSIVKKYGGFTFFSKDNVIYVKSNIGAGLTSNSIVYMSYQLSLEILGHLINAKEGQITTLNKLNQFRRKIECEIESITLV